MIEYGLTPQEADNFYKITLRDPMWVEFDLENIPYKEAEELFIKKYPDQEDALRYFFENDHKMPVARPNVYEKCEQLLDKGYKLYILSNYSSKLFETHTSIIPIINRFTGKVVSYMIHKIKPDHAIYEELYKRYSINPHESLFFDDRAENVQASIETGMDAIIVESEDGLINDLEKILES